MASQVKKYPESVYDFTVKDAKGTDVDLSIFKEKVLLIVNVASKCGMTDSNYTELNQLYEKYNKLGLEILAFPCNQFGAEEPGSNDEISDFVCTRFKSELPIFDKVIPLLRLTLHRLSLLEIMELAFASITQVVVVDFNKWALDCFGDYI